MEKTGQNGKKLDRRVVRTRKAIMEAFERLLATTDVNKITVSAVAREADIDRKTFYLHYSSIDDLVNRKAEACLERVLIAVRENAANKSLRDRTSVALQEVNEIITNDIDMYARVANLLTIDQLLEYFFRATLPAIEHSGYKPECMESNASARLLFYVSGAISLYVAWLRNGHKEPIETVSDAIASSVN